MLNRNDNLDDSFLSEEIPDIGFKDIIGHDEAKLKIIENVILPLKLPLSIQSQLFCAFLFKFYRDVSFYSKERDRSPQHPTIRY